MKRHKRLSSDTTVLGLAFLASCLSYALLRLDVLPMSLSAVATRPDQSTSVLDERFVAILILVYSLAIGFTLQHRGARRIWTYLAATFLVVVALGALGSKFLSFNLPVVPVILAGALTFVTVQLHRLWAMDRQLTRALFSSASSLGPIQPAGVSTQLDSGLKMLDTVLLLREAVVFGSSNSDPFQIIARLKGTKGQANQAVSNVLWRDGIKLCEGAMADRKIRSSTVEDNSSNVAVPLLHESEIVGVLLLRLASAFNDDDRPLLEAVSYQFARNIKRHSFSSNPVHNYTFGYLSQTSSQKKLDALYVLRAYLTEERCNAEALGQINDGAALAYLDGTLAFTNARLLQFAGITSEQANGLNLFGLLEHLCTGVFDEPALAVKRVLQTGVDYEGELEYVDKALTLGLRISLLRNSTDENGSIDPIGVAVYVRDLTKSKEYDKLKSDMISLMSHELRTPLTSINGFAELLTQDETIPEQAREFVTIIANEAQRLSRMINTFLAVTQLQRKDKQEVLKIPLRLDEVVRDTISTLQTMAKKKRIRLVEQPAHRVPPVAADKSLITQVVKNLVHNAIKYSPERTTVTVSTALEAEAVRVSVEDRGFGIPTEARDRVWEKFYRVVREGQEKDEESTGLGLSFVREVVEQHGGQVQLDSEEGQGSKFSFTLPRL